MATTTKTDELSADAIAQLQANEMAPGDALTFASAPVTVTPSVALPGMPALNSRPDAHTAIYLDFNGDAGGMSAYDEDGDPTTFNAAEQASITEAWRQIATYFAPFDVTVTTVKPTIPMAWGMITDSLTGVGYSYIGVFPNTSPESFNPAGDARTRESGLAHEYGHNFGLQHQSTYDLLGNKTAEYSSGFDSLHGPIMGVDYAQSVHKWFIGHNSLSPSSLQDDMAVIANKIKAKEPVGGDGYYTDDYGNTIAAATPLAITGATQSLGGIIERMNDVDVYSFTSDGNPFNLDVSPVSPSGLAPQFQVFAADGTLLSSVDDTSDRTANNNDEQVTLSLPAGTYYISVSSHGNYGDVGMYTVGVRDLPAGWATQDVGTPTTQGFAGFDPSTSTFTVAGAGNDIYNNSDSLRYVYQPLNGDGTMIARVTSMEATNMWAKAGIDIRESTAGGSKHVGVFATSSGGNYMNWRTTTAGSTTSKTSTAAAFTSVWVKLTRAGNVFTGYFSADGITWTQFNQLTVAMNTNVLIGLATSAHNTAVVNHATFDNVSFTGGVGTPAPTYNAMSAPTGLTVTPGVGTGLTLNWLAVAGAAGYVIERSTDNATFIQIGTTAAGVTTYSDNSLFGSMRYFYRVSTMDAIGRSVPSAERDALNRPNAPSNFTISSWQADKLILDWRDVSGETGYRIEKSTDGTNFSTLASVGVNIPSYTDTGLATGTQYWYRIIATSAQGDSPASTIGTDGTRLLADTGMAFTSVTPTAMSISWTPIVGATGYRIDRSTDGATYTALTSLGAAASSYTDATVTSLGEYYYRVIGTYALSESVAPTAIFAAAPSAVALPTPWQSQDIGTVNGTGATAVASGTHTIVANGGDIWSTADQFRYDYQPLVGDGQIIARVATQENTGAWAKAGVMMRESLAAGSRQAMMMDTPSNGVNFVYRSATSGSSTNVAGTASVVAPYWVKLVRAGNLFTGYSSSDGVTWTQVSSVTIAMNASIYVGLAADSYTSTTLNKTTFDNITLSNAAPTVATAAAAAPSTVTGQTAALSVLGADDHSEPALTYTWTTTTLPAGATTPVFSANASNSAKATTATFYKAGAYTFKVTITDASGLQTTSTVNVTVSQTLASVTVTPGTASLGAGKTQQYTAAGVDQFGAALAKTWTWAVTGTGNSITTAGNLTTGSTTGNFTVTATSGTISGSSTVSVDAAAPTVQIAAMPSGATAANTATITFSRSVTGLTLAGLQLTRNGGTNLLTASQTLSTTDHVTWALSNLSGLTGLLGRYQLTVVGPSAAVVDAVGNTLATGTSATWGMAGFNAAGGAYLMRDADGSNVDVWQNTSSPGVTAYSQQLPLTMMAQLPALSATGSAGDDTLVLDFSQGSPLPVGGLNFDGGAGNNTVSLIGSTAAETVNVTASSLTFAANATGSAATPVGLANVSAIKFAGAGGGDVLNITSGAFALDSDSPNGVAPVAVTASGTGTAVTFSRTQHLAGLTLNGQAKAAVAATARGTPPSVLVTGGLSITGGSSLDLRNNDLVLNYTPTQEAATLSALTTWIASGLYNGPTGFWDGPGVNSSSAAADPAQLHSLGILDNNDGSGGANYPTFGTEAVSGNSVLVGYTLFGDADLNGVVNADDFTQFLSGYHHTAAPGWVVGDFDYNNVVNADDFTLLLGGLKSGQTAAPAAAQDATPAASPSAPPVPEVAADVPVVDAPVGETPAADVPRADVPVADVPVADSAVSSAPALLSTPLSTVATSGSNASTDSYIPPLPSAPTQPVAVATVAPPEQSAVMIQTPSLMPAAVPVDPIEAVWSTADAIPFAPALQRVLTDGHPRGPAVSTQSDTAGVRLSSRHAGQPPVKLSNVVPGHRTAAAIFTTRAILHAHTAALVTRSNDASAAAIALVTSTAANVASPFSTPSGDRFDDLLGSGSAPLTLPEAGQRHREPTVLR